MLLMGLEILMTQATRSVETSKTTCLEAPRDFQVERYCDVVTRNLQVEKFNYWWKDGRAWFNIKLRP